VSEFAHDGGRLALVVFNAVPQLRAEQVTNV
jgi:hypothetical protein